MFCCQRQHHHSLHDFTINISSSFHQHRNNYRPSIIIRSDNTIAIGIHHAMIKSSQPSSSSSSPVFVVDVTSAAHFGNTCKYQLVAGRGLLATTRAEIRSTTKPRVGNCAGRAQLIASASPVENQSSLAWAITQRLLAQLWEHVLVPGSVNSRPCQHSTSQMHVQQEERTVGSSNA